MHIGALLGRMCEEDGIERRLAEIDVCACWNDVVGAEIAAMTRDIGCRDGVFYVSCMSVPLSYRIYTNILTMQICKVNFYLDICFLICSYYINYKYIFGGHSYGL